MFCAVEECRNSLRGSSQSFFRFPIDPKLRRQWTLFCRRVDDINYPVERVCLEHFEMEDFERDLRLGRGICGYLTPLKLKPEAVPSLQSHQDIDLEIVEGHLVPPEAKEEPLLVEYDKEPVRDQPEESESDYEFEELPAEECLQVQVVDADGYLKVLEKENAELKRDNLIMNLSIQTSERDMERLQRQLDKSNERYGQLVANLERIFSPAQIEKIQNDRRIVWPRADLIEAHNLYAASRSVYNMLLRSNYPLPSVRTMQYWEAREWSRTTSTPKQTAQRRAPEQAMYHLFEVIDATNLDHNYT